MYTHTHPNHVFTSIQYVCGLVLDSFTSSSSCSFCGFCVFCVFWLGGYSSWPLRGALNAERPKKLKYKRCQNIMCTQRKCFRFGICSYLSSIYS